MSKFVNLEQIKVLANKVNGAALAISERWLTS